MKMSRKTTLLGFLCVVIAAVMLYSIWGLGSGHLPGFTYIQPGNVGLVLDTYSGTTESRLFPAGTHYQGPWETVIEIPTMLRTINLASNDEDSDGNIVDNSVQVNTPSNMLKVEVSCQYEIDPNEARNLYATYQDQFSNLKAFERVNLEPAVKEAINYAIGDQDTMTALTTVGKQRAEQDALKQLNDEWSPRGIVFSNFMVRAITPDDATKSLLSSTLQAVQNIENAKIALQQQQIDNENTINVAKADAKINNYQNSSLTDLYVQDAELNQVKTIYVPSSELLGEAKAK